MPEHLKINFGPQAVIVAGVAHRLGQASIGEHAIQGFVGDAEDLRYLTTVVKTIVEWNVLGHRPTKMVGGEGKGVQGKTLVKTGTMTLDRPEKRRPGTPWRPLTDVHVRFGVTVL